MFNPSFSTGHSQPRSSTLLVLGRLRRGTYLFDVLEPLDVLLCLRSLPSNLPEPRLPLISDSISFPALRSLISFSYDHIFTRSDLWRGRVGADEEDVDDENVDDKLDWRRRLLLLWRWLFFFSLSRQSFINSPAKFRTRTAPSLSARRWIVWNIPYCRISNSLCSLASQIVRRILKRFSRTTGLLWVNSSRIRAKNSGLPTAYASCGLRRNSFWSGSRIFSKDFFFDPLKQLIIAAVNGTLSSLSSTLAVSSCNLEPLLTRILRVGPRETYQTRIASRAVTCQYWSESSPI